MNFAFAGYPSAFVFEAPDGKKIDHLLWGTSSDCWVLKLTTG